MANEYFEKQVKALAIFLRREFPDEVRAEEAKGESGKSAVELAMHLLKQSKEITNGRQ